MKLMEENEEGLKIFKCSECGTEVPTGSKFCTECGKPLPESQPPLELTKSMCPKCYAEFPPEVKYCKQCGTKTKQIADNSHEYTCPRCYSEIEPGLSYCPVCGTNLLGSNQTCPKCARKIPPGMRYCPACGTTLKAKKTSAASISEKLKKRRKTTSKTSSTTYPPEFAMMHEKTEKSKDLSASSKKTTDKIKTDLETPQPIPLKENAEEDVDKHGYLVCDGCGGYYELQPGESPDDFTDICDCGGKLQYKLKL